VCTGVEPANSCEETMIRTACILPAATEPPLVTPSIQTAAEVTTVVSAVILGSTAVTSLQFSCLFGGHYCARPAVKNMAKDASWTLAPLAPVAVQVCPQPVHMMVWNLIFGVCFSAVHYGLLKLSAWYREKSSEPV